MNKDKIVKDVEFVLNEMLQSRNSRGLELWPLQDYKEIVLLIRENDWNFFGKFELEKIDGIVSRYFGRGEVALLYCPKIIKYEDIILAKDGLCSIMELIRNRMIS